MAPKTDVPAAPAEEVALGFVLPVLVVSPADVGRLLRELETIDNQLLQLGLRDGEDAKAPETSGLLGQTVQLNKFDLLDQKSRQALHISLQEVREKSPVIHMSFSVDPNTAFIKKIMVWLRREIHPQVLLTIGLQPNIGAGCIVRSTNKYFDFSLRQNFANKRDLLLKKIVEATKTDLKNSAPQAVPTVLPTLVNPTAPQPEKVAA